MKHLTLLYIPVKSSRLPKFGLAILTLALGSLVASKPASATTFQYAFTFTAQNVIDAITASNPGVAPKLGVFSFFMEPPTGVTYTYTGQTASQIAPQPVDPWTSGTIVDFADLGTTDTYAYFGKVSQPNVQVIAQTATTAFNSGSYTGTASAPVNFGGVSETFAGKIAPSTQFTILLTAASMNNLVTFTGLASAVEASTSSTLGVGKTDTKLAFSMNLSSVAPEPGTWAMLLGGIGLVLVGAYRRKPTR